MQETQHTHQVLKNKNYATPEECWELQNFDLTRLCPIEETPYFPNIWSDTPPFKKEKARAALETACPNQAWVLNLKPHWITHTVASFLLVLAFHTEDPSRVSYTINIFMFLDLYLASGTKAAMIPRQWDISLDSNTLVPYSNTNTLTKNQNTAPIFGWKGAANIMEHWIMFLDFILGPPKIILLSMSSTCSSKRPARRVNNSACRRNTKLTCWNISFNFFKHISMRT